MNVDIYFTYIYIHIICLIVYMDISEGHKKGGMEFQKSDPSED